MTARAGIVSPIKSNCAKHLRAGGNLPWTYSILTPGTDAGKIVWAANSAYAINTGALSFWSKVPTGLGVKIMIEIYTSTNERSSLYYFNNVLTASSVKAGVVILNNTAGFTNDGNWHHFSWTWDSTNCVVYIDGVATATFAGNYTLSLTSPQIVIGSALSTAGFPCGGNFMGLSIYNAKLSALQVAGIYRANQIPPSCVGIWDFGRGVGTTITPTFGPNANAGTLGTGDTWTTTVPAGKTRLASNGISIGE